MRILCAYTLNEHSWHNLTKDELIRICHEGHTPKEGFWLVVGNGANWGNLKSKTKMQKCKI